MSDPDKPWRLPDAKPMTFDEMTARAQYEWQRAEDAEAEARALGAERDALAEKLERAVACLEEIKLDCMERAKIDRRGVSTVPISNGTWQTLRATLAQITGGKTDG